MQLIFELPPDTRARLTMLAEIQAEAASKEQAGSTATVRDGNLDD